jgi:hypothetical protein
MEHDGAFKVHAVHYDVPVAFAARVRDERYIHITPALERGRDYIRPQ